MDTRTKFLIGEVDLVFQTESLLAGAACLAGSLEGYCIDPFTVDQEEGLINSLGSDIGRDLENVRRCLVRTKDYIRDLESCLRSTEDLIADLYYNSEINTEVLEGAVMAHLSESLLPERSGSIFSSQGFLGKLIQPLSAEGLKKVTDRVEVSVQKGELVVISFHTKDISYYQKSFKVNSKHYEYSDYFKDPLKPTEEELVIFQLEFQQDFLTISLDLIKKETADGL